MEGKLLAFFRWLFRLDRKQDPILENYLRKNREALDRQRGELSKTGLEIPKDRVEEPSEEPEEELEHFPRIEEDQFDESQSSSQRHLPLRHEKASSS